MRVGFRVYALATQTGLARSLGARVECEKLDRAAPFRVWAPAAIMCCLKV